MDIGEHHKKYGHPNFNLTKMLSVEKTPVAESLF